MLQELIKNQHDNKGAPKEDAVDPNTPRKEQSDEYKSTSTPFTSIDYDDGWDADDRELGLFSPDGADGDLYHHKKRKCYYYKKHYYYEHGHKKYYSKKYYYYTYDKCGHHLYGDKMDLEYVVDSTSQEQPVDEYEWYSTSTDDDDDNDEVAVGGDLDLISSTDADINFHRKHKKHEKHYGHKKHQKHDGHKKNYKNHKRHHEGNEGTFSASEY